ncbi:hypothetical protein [Wukongibacter baidiensis]
MSNESNHKIIDKLLDVPESTKPLSTVIECINQSSTIYASSLSYALGRYHETINKVSYIFQKNNALFKDLPQSIRNSLELLSNFGWYVDMDDTFLFLKQITRELNEGNINLVDNILCEHYEDRLEEIKSFIIGHFPNRYEIIASAFDAHNQGAYALSVPILLIQVDGMCKERVDGYFFMRENKIPQTAKFVNDKEEIRDESIRGAFLNPLKSISTIQKNKNEREESFKGLNRHLIIHGDSLDYNTRVNSYKAISLINYIAKVLSDINDIGE